jgi:hypothetical protein
MSNPNRDVNIAGPNATDNEVATAFRVMEENLASSNPEIMDLLEVYGGYQAAIQQADAYLSVLLLSPVSITRDRSSS